MVLNRVARSVIEAQRGAHPEFVFALRNRPVERIHNQASRNPQARSGFPHVRVHDLKYRFGRRRAFRSRIGRISSDTSRVASPRTTQRRSCGT